MLKSKFKTELYIIDITSSDDVNFKHDIEKKSEIPRQPGNDIHCDTVFSAIKINFLFTYLNCKSYCKQKLSGLILSNLTRLNPIK